MLLETCTAAIYCVLSSCFYNREHQKYLIHGTFIVQTKVEKNAIKPRELLVFHSFFLFVFFSCHTKDEKENHFKMNRIQRLSNQGSVTIHQWNVDLSLKFNKFQNDVSQIQSIWTTLFCKNFD